LPADGSLDVSHFQKFMKRLRDRIKDSQHIGRKEFSNHELKEPRNEGRLNEMKI
jgi:hypothetical protein